MTGSLAFAWLAPLNTALILVSGLAVMAGYLCIRARKVPWHHRLMLTASGFAAAFLVVYAVRWALVGSKPFTGAGWLRAAYLSVLASHVILAILLAPLALVTLRRALQGQWDAHRHLARRALPVWLYVAASGWVVYWMLYGLR